MSPLELISWPYHAGLAEVGMGRGPAALASSEQFQACLSGAGWQTRVVQVEPVDETQPELARVFALVRGLSSSVAAACRRGAFPLVLAGNCISSLATTAALSADGELGVVSLDAHADFDTPEDNLSGFTDVMALATLTGCCFRALRETIPGFTTVDQRHVVLAGVRDLEPYQRERLAGSDVRAVPGAIPMDALESALDALRDRVSRIYLHIDLDVLDRSVGHANPYAAAGGPDLDRVLGAVDATCARFSVGAAALTAYDPQCDETGAIAAAAGSIAARIAARVAAAG